MEYKIIRSAARRKLTITVERDRSVVVHAPQNASEERILQVIEAKKQWIFEKARHPQKYTNLPHPPGKELVNGEAALYRGREYRIEIVQGGSGAIELTDRFLVPTSLMRAQREAFRDWYIARAEEEILPRARHHAKQLGVEYAEARIVDNRYRWGSCTVNDNVSFNWRLVKAPTPVIDYVVVHELAHLIEANHTPRFWNIVRSQVAHADKARQWLKEHGQLLEQAI